MAEPRVIVVGAGPAGICAAQTLVAAGIRPVVVDEGQRDGGQIYRRQPENFKRSYAALYGTEAARAKAMHQRFEALRGHIDYMPQTLVWNIAGQDVYVAQGDRLATLPFTALILATGAIDRLMPVKGWTLAGTYSLGGAQIALKAQACAIGRQVVFMGTGALLYLVAAQYLKAGAHVAAVLDTSPWMGRIAALPQLMAQPSILWQGVALAWALRRAGVPVHTRVTPLEIEGGPASGVSHLRFRDRRGRVRRIACDAVAMGYHLRPETQLADLAKCDFEFDADTRQWLPWTDMDGRTSQAGIYLAGDGARVLGARAAAVSGRLAALAALCDLGHGDATPRMARLRRRLGRYRRFAGGLARAFAWPAALAAALDDETIVCRCECVSAGQLRQVVTEGSASEANRAKAFSRVGMGRCQGRYCGHA
ncbi:MAG: FAD/NAD(P)-binding oxidoreductase, partial [Alphaproteobacteria bacterium]